MSHSATITFTICTQKEKEELNQYKNFLNDFNNLLSQDIYKNTLNNILSQIDETITILNNISGTKTGTIYTQQDYLFQKNNIMKKIQNLDYSTKYLNIYLNDIKIKRENEKEDIQNLFDSYGIIAVNAYEELKNKNIEISFEQLNSKILEIRYEKVHKEKTKEFNKNILQIFKESKFPKEIIDSLFDRLTEISTLQEQSDFLALIKNISSDFFQLDEKIKAYLEAFKIEGYNYVSQKFIIKKDSSKNLNDSFYKQINLKNKNNNPVSLVFDLNGNLTYDIGDYEKHVCHETAQNVQKNVEKKGYIYNDIKITRNASNAKAMTIEIKKEKENIK
ncbi:hypothetical protein [Mycoplasma sp. CB776]